MTASETNGLNDPEASKSFETRVLSDSGGASYALEMTVDGWIALLDHPRQRDTERQSTKSHWKLARRARGPIAESHRWVIGAELDGVLYKVDGHTRALLWQQGKLQDPKTVYATIYRCKTREELLALYETFDSQGAVEKQQDRLTGAIRSLRLKFDSKRLRYATFTDSLAIAARGVARGKDAFGKRYEEFDVYEALEMFAPELRLLDAVDPQPDIFHSGVLAAGMLALAVDKENFGFFAQLSKRTGKKKDTPPFDPVEGIRWLMTHTKQAGTGRSKLTQENICATVLGAVELYAQGEGSSEYWSENGRIENPPSVLDYVQKVRTLKSAGTRSF